mmetsp:Transcript_78552/g.235470  ORF Transcript_78552/g.235470 Transcript_78552/m.235470 type:complete len:206 (+) Transcript_78552:237-854(+)
MPSRQPTTTATTTSSCSSPAQNGGSFSTRTRRPTSMASPPTTHSIPSHASTSRWATTSCESGGPERRTRAAPAWWSRQAISSSCRKAYGTRSTRSMRTTSRSTSSSRRRRSSLAPASTHPSPAAQRRWRLEGFPSTDAQPASPSSPRRSRDSSGLWRGRNGRLPRCKLQSVTPASGRVAPRRTAAAATASSPTWSMACGKCLTGA